MKRVILAGGGHGHINVLKMLAKKPICDVDIILISNFDRQYYSGMLPGFIEGIYTEEDISFDVYDLCKKAGVTYVNSKIVEIDGDKKTVTTIDNKYSYDYISMNLGLASRDDFKLIYENESYVKPISRLVAFKNFLEKNYGNSRDEKEFVIVGAGASGIELAFAFREKYPNLKIKVLARGNDFLTTFNENFKTKIKGLLNEKSIELVFSCKLLGIEKKYLETSKGEVSYDYLILANGYRGVDVVYKGFDLSKENYLLTDDYLRSKKDSLAMGDMISLRSKRNLVKAGVFAIRQAPVLFNNLLYMLGERKKKKSYRAQDKYLQIINIGSKKALMSYANIAFYGKWVWKIKDYIDRRYMNK